MDAILQRIYEYVSGIAHVRNTLATLLGERFDEWPEPTGDPHALHAMCFPPPRYWSEISERADHR